MASEIDEVVSANVYDLSCTDCSFETTVEGDVFDALDVSSDHQEEYGDAPTEHFVNLELQGH